MWPLTESHSFMDYYNVHVLQLANTRLQYFVSESLWRGFPSPCMNPCMHTLKVFMYIHEYMCIVL